MADCPVVKIKVTEDQLKPTHRLWDNYKVVGEVQKSNSIKFVFGAGVRDGVRYINIREFYLRKRDGVWKPGRDGITIPLAVPINEGACLLKPYEGFEAMLNETAYALNTMELYDEDNAVYAVKKERNI